MLSRAAGPSARAMTRAMSEGAAEKSGGGEAAAAAVHPSRLMQFV